MDEMDEILAHLKGYICNIGHYSGLFMEISNSFNLMHFF
jgi:hypothetical protein